MVRFRENDLIGVCDRWNGSNFVRHQPEVVLDGMGISGMTAYFGIADHLHPGANSVLVVSAASGAVGSIAGQIGKRLGFAKVVGVTSTAEKADSIRQLGFDEAVVYNSGAAAEWEDDLRSACGGGIDCYFDNVGGDVSLAVAELLNKGASCAICGAMSQTAHGGADQAWVEVAKRRGAAVTWFRYTSYMDDEDGRVAQARAQLQQWMEEGTLTIVRTYFDGLASAASCFVALFSGSKLGKAVIRLSA